MASSDEVEKRPRAIAHFRIIDKLGEGGMGVVYRARDEKLGRVVALKVLPEDLVRDPERRHRFLREARSAAAVTHQNIAAVYEVGEQDEQIYIAMEYIEGQTLRALLEAGAVPIERAIRIASGILTGLAKAHAAGVIHRDLKPDNVMLADDDHVKILDFGLAKLEEDTNPGLAKTSPQNDAPTAISLATKEGRVLGTPQYMSPEQAAGRSIDRRTDIFSMSVVLFEMLTGQRPFTGTTALELIAAIQRDAPPAPSSLNPAVSPALDRVVARAFEKDPERRYASCRAMLADLTTGIGESAPARGNSAPTVMDVPNAPSASSATTSSPPAVPKYLFVPIAVVLALIGAAFAAFAVIAKPPAGGTADMTSAPALAVASASASASAAPLVPPLDPEPVTDAAVGGALDAAVVTASTSTWKPIAPRPSATARTTGSPPASASGPLGGMSETQR